MAVHMVLPPFFVNSGPKIYHHITMRINFWPSLLMIAVAVSGMSLLQSCSDNDNDEPEIEVDGMHFMQSSGQGYTAGKSVSVKSENGPQPGQDHRSSSNFSTSALDDSSTGGTPSYMVVSCPEGVTFKLQVDKTGKDEVWNKDVYNGAILPYRNEGKFYIADPSGAKAGFTVKITAIYTRNDNVFVSSPGHHLSDQSHRASLNFVLPTNHMRYKVHCSDKSASFNIYEDISAANDDKIAHTVKDGDVVLLSRSKRNYYLTDPDKATKPFQVRFEPMPEAWMDRIGDNTSIADISIPGTHDTGTYKLEAVNFGFSKCQNMDMSQQLKFGIRYFDLRVSGSMDLEHGGIPCNVSFDEIVRTTCDFLKENPSEAVIFEISADSEFGGKFDSYLKSHSDLNAYFWKNNYVPRLGEVRGKIMIVRRYVYNGTQGLDFSSSDVWPYDDSKSGTTDDGIKYNIEDKYFRPESTDTHDTHVKRDKLNEAIDYKRNHAGVFSIAFASLSASVSHTPYMFMWGGGTPGVDPVMSDVIVDKIKSFPAGRQCIGIIVMDYFNNNGHDDNRHVVERIINTNFENSAHPFDPDRIHSSQD